MSFQLLYFVVLISISLKWSRPNTIGNKGEVAFEKVISFAPDPVEYWNWIKNEFEAMHIT